MVQRDASQFQKNVTGEVIESPAASTAPIAVPVPSEPEVPIEKDGLKVFPRTKIVYKTENVVIHFAKPVPDEKPDPSLDGHPNGDEQAPPNPR